MENVWKFILIFPEISGKLNFPTSTLICPINHSLFDISSVLYVAKRVKMAIIIVIPVVIG